MTTDVLEACFGGRPVRENLDQAVARGKIAVLPDGRWTIPAQSASWYLPVKFALNLECNFLNDFLFLHAFDKAAVPTGCRACFKVKVAPANFRGLIALRTVLEGLPYHSKCGIDFFNVYSRDFYAGYLYFTSLADAQAGWRELRGLADAHPHLGRDTHITIKRGCSNYEETCGPSDRWTFAEGQEAIEAELRAKFAPPAKPPFNYAVLRATKMAQWLQIAYNLRDDTYLDFTGGKPLHPGTKTYSPDDAAP